MIEDFGGTVTGSVSGKTDYIVVGKEPGRKKVSEGEKRGIPLLGLMSLRKLLTGDDIAGDEPGKLAVFFFRFLFLVSSVNSPTDCSANHAFFEGLRQQAHRVLRDARPCETLRLPAWSSPSISDS